MSEFLSTVTRKGQITLPTTIRKALGIEIGDKVSFSIQEGEDGVIIVRPVRSVAEMTYGLGAALSTVASDLRGKSTRELRDAFERGMAEDVMESPERKA